MRDLKRRKEELQAALSEARDQATVAYEEKLNTVRRLDEGHAVRHTTQGRNPTSPGVYDLIPTSSDDSVLQELGRLREESAKELADLKTTSRWAPNG